MKRNFNTPTIASMNKTSADPASLRDKVQKLSSAVKELRQNAVQEDTYLETLQNTNMKNYEVLNQQVQTIKRSFNQLSDILLGEITNMGDTFGQAVNTINSKIDNLTHQQQKQTSITDELNSNYREIENQVQLMINRNREQDISTKQLMDGLNNLNTSYQRDRDETKPAIEKIRLQVNNCQSQIENINKDKNTQYPIITEMKSKLQQVLGAQVIQDKRLFELEEFNKINNIEINSKINELKTQFNTQTDFYKTESSFTIKELSSIIKNIEEKLKLADENQNQIEKSLRKKNTEIESQINITHQEFQQDLQELAQIYKESTSQVIIDFDKAVNGQYSELKELKRQFDEFENAQADFIEDVQLKIARLDMGRWKDK